MNFFSGIFTKVMAALAVLAGILGSIALYGRSKKIEGRAEIEKEQLKEGLDAVQDKNDLDRELDDADARKRMRDKHYRD